jgi:pantoate--beta-alanine ligase
LLIFPKPYICLPFIPSFLKIASTKSELEILLSPHREGKRSIGFVPTMGALHKGHITLVNLSTKENDVTICSIFVNPTQFNDPADLKRYPRPVDSDCEMLEVANCDILFMPSVEEMYPDNDYTLLNEDFGGLDKVMEGKSRPGHFAGMITIVNKLFLAVKPQKAYFGNKDFQQLSLVKYFVKKHGLPVIVRECPISRDTDGLAMSSRNRLLSTEERKAAGLIPDMLSKVKELWGTKNIRELNEIVESGFAGNPILKLDYFEIVHFETLMSLSEPISPEIPVIACIAVFAGKIRLIDNIRLQ